MTPNEQGIWEWYDKKGVRRLLEVHNVETNFNYPQHLRVRFNNKYFNVRDQPLNITDTQAEWPDNWGARIGDLGSVPNQDLYLCDNCDDQLQLPLTTPSGHDTTCW